MLLQIVQCDATFVGSCGEPKVQSVPTELREVSVRARGSGRVVALTRAATAGAVGDPPIWTRFPDGIASSNIARTDACTLVYY